MKNILFVLSVLFSPASLNAQIKINDIHAVAREVKSFHSISISSAIDLYISQGGEEALAVSSSDPAFIPSIKTIVKDGTLKIWVENKNNWGNNNKNSKVYVSFKQLDGLSISGACDVFIVDQINTKKLKIDISGASNLKGNVVIDELVMDQSGASDVSLTGTIKTLQIKSSGASDFKGFEVAINYCNAKISGASDFKITVNKEITGTVSGASTVHLKGNGDYSELKASGASSIKKK